MATFDLLKNPFVLLGVSTRDGREAIAEALENHLAEGEIDEEDLHRAQQTLMASKSRLQAEMSWLIGMAPSRVKGVVAALEGNDEEAIEQVLTRHRAGANPVGWSPRSSGIRASFFRVWGLIRFAAQA